MSTSSTSTSTSTTLASTTTTTTLVARDGNIYVRQNNVHPLLRRSDRVRTPTSHTMIDYITPGRGQHGQTYGYYRYANLMDNEDTTLVVTTEPAYALQDLQDIQDQFQQEGLQEAQDQDADDNHFIDEILGQEADPENPVMGIPFDYEPYLPPAPPAAAVLPPHLDRMPSGSQLCTCVDTLTGMTCHYPMLIGPEPFCDECLETKIDEAKATLRGLLKRKATVAGVIDLTHE